MADHETKGEALPLRVVVTGNKPDGRSCFTYVGDPDTSVGFPRAYGYDEVPTVPTDGTVLLKESLLPDLGGLRTFYTIFPAGWRAGPPDMSGGYQHVPGPGNMWMDMDTFMHHTDTIDIGFVLSGEVVSETDDGEVTLRRGDVIIQNGTYHAWHNRSDSDCVVGFVAVGTPAKR